MKQVIFEYHDDRVFTRSFDTIEQARAAAAKTSPWGDGVVLYRIYAMGALVEQGCLNSRETFPLRPGRHDNPLRGMSDLSAFDADRRRNIVAGAVSAGLRRRAAETRGYVWVLTDRRLRHRHYAVAAEAPDAIAEFERRSLSVLRAGDADTLSELFRVRADGTSVDRSIQLHSYRRDPVFPEYRQARAAA